MTPLSFFFTGFTIVILSHHFIKTPQQSAITFERPELSSIFNRPFTNFQEFKAELDNGRSGQSTNINFQPTADSLNNHKIPEWWRDGKLGIFIHWGLYSVPGFSPTDYMFHDDVPKETHVKFNPYAEWYMNTMRYEGSPTKKFHEEHYGGRPYIDFVPDFNSQIIKWSPTYWAKTIKSLSATYVVLTTKHHDGYTLWPSRINNPYRTAQERYIARDIVGELSNAIWSENIVMGLYYSGGRDWSFDFEIDPKKFIPSVPQSEEYANYFSRVGVLF